MNLDGGLITDACKQCGCILRVSLNKTFLLACVSCTGCDFFEVVDVTVHRRRRQHE